MKEKALHPKICKNCKTKFNAKRPHALFCDDSCRMAFWRKEHPYIKPEELKEIKQKLGIEED